MNKVNTFPALTAPHTLNLLSNLPITGKAALVADSGKKNLAKETARSYLNYLSYYQEIHLI